MKVITNAKTPGAEKLADGTWRVKVKAKPLRGAANSELKEVLANAWGLRKRQIEIKWGRSSREKIIEIKER